MFVDVELHGEFTRGQTVADRRGTAVPLHNADVCVEVDRTQFATGFLAAIKGLSKARGRSLASGVRLSGQHWGQDIERTVAIGPYRRSRR